MKILSPAGNLQCLKAAVNNGADEVYLGINQFNARNNVDGFTIDSLSEAVDFAHIFGVKVNLAINILFTDEEIFDAVKTVVKAYNLGVDAIIVQDLGLFDKVICDAPCSGIGVIRRKPEIKYKNLGEYSDISDIQCKILEEIAWI